jgi:ParB-like chromosome segregation protein Spo0J
MNVIKVPISQLVNDPNNARKHGTKNLSAIKGSLAKFGQQKPIVIDAKNVVIAGNGTLEAAKQLGWTHINAVVTELDDLGKMAFALADNKTSELAEWDESMLMGQLDWLDKMDFDIGDIGFDDTKFDDVPTSDLPDLDDGDKKTLSQMVFILHPDQVEILELAIKKCSDKSLSFDQDINKNKNGNIITYICERFLNGN